MTNFEKMLGAEIGENNKIEKIHKIIQELNMYRANPFFDYIDWQKFLASEDENKEHFIQRIGEGQIVPSIMEVTSYCNEQKLKSKEMTEEEILSFINSNYRKCFILDVKMIFGGKYFVIADLEANKVLKVPYFSVLVTDGNEEILGSFETEFDIKKECWQNYFNLIKSYKNTNV